MLEKCLKKCRQSGQPFHMHKKFRYVVAAYFMLLSVACSDSGPVTPNTTSRETRRITYNGVSVEVVIEKPTVAAGSLDAIITYHGTVFQDSKILEAAHTTLTQVKEITQRKDVVFVSVAYPEEGLLMGDNIRESEAALLWVKNNASKELGIAIRKIFLVGHSQGGYLVTRLSTMHPTDGIVANAPGPLNLELRCRLEDERQLPATPACGLMQRHYGTITQNPTAYRERSLLSFTDGYKSNMLFIQGLQDAQIQLASWPLFRQQTAQCSTCRNIRFLDIPEGGHTALFDSPEAQQVYNDFIKP